MTFLEELNALIPQALPGIRSPLPPRRLDVDINIDQSEAVSAEKPTDPPQVSMQPKPRDKGLELYRYWSVKSQTEKRRTTRAAFLDSLKGWSEANTGSHLSPASQTCDWAAAEVNITLLAKCSSLSKLFIIGNAGQGKSHFLKALHEQLEVARPQDVVLDFYCTPGTEKPSLWEYFTWNLIKKHTRWFNEVPTRFRGRDKNSPPLDLGSFIDIWHSFGQVRYPSTIWLLVDGLEQCGEESLEEFLTSLESLKTRIIGTTQPTSEATRSGFKFPIAIKVVFTCRLTPAVVNAQAADFRLILNAGKTESDIATYVDTHLDQLAKTSTLVGQEEIEGLRSQIKEFSGPYWWYAKYALQAVRRGTPFGALLTFNAENDMPMGLRQWYGEHILPQLQFIEVAWPLRVLLNICISQTYDELLTVHQLESILQCLDSSGRTEQADITHALMISCSDILLVLPNGRMRFVHPSIAWYVSGLHSFEQRHTNMAFLCLKYLMQEKFRIPLNLRRQDTAEGAKWLNDTHPFYDYAATEWAYHLKRSKDLVHQLLPLVCDFTTSARAQYNTWNKWHVWKYGPSISAEATQPMAVALINENCVNVLEHFLARPALSPHATNWDLPSQVTELSSLSWSALRAGFFHARPHLIDACDWPETTGRNGNTAIISAIFTRRIEMVRFVLQYKPDMNVLSGAGETALMCAVPSIGSVDAREDTHAILELLLSNGADPNTCDSWDGMTALHLSCYAGWKESTLALLRYSALVNVSTLTGVTPLQFAYRSDNEELLKMIIDAGADVDAWWSQGRGSLHQCIKDSNLDAFRVILSVADVNQVDRAGFAPIHLASRLPDRLEFLKLLVAKPDVDLDMPKRNWWGNTERSISKALTALSLASQRGESLAVEVLLRAGANPGTLSDIGETPLHHAAQCRNATIARLLLEYGACVNVFTRHCSPGTPLGIAAKNGDEEMVDILLKHKADPTIEEAYEVDGPLIQALQTGEPNLAIIQQILEAQVKPTLNPYGSMRGQPLTLAVRRGKIDLVRLLLDHGADLSRWLGPSERLSPLHAAVAEGHLDICKLLLERQPELVNAQYEQGVQASSPLHLACNRKRAAIVKFLLEKGARAEQTSFHFQESCLLVASGVGHLETVQTVLEAAPQMVNLESLDGETPLSRACMQKNVRVVDMLLQAGAEISKMDEYGTSCIGPKFFDGTTRVGQVLELLVRFGLDLNSVITTRGLTVLGLAIAHGLPRDLKWLLDHGADPTKCQRSPSELVIWRNCLQVACVFRRPDQVAVLLESAWATPDALRCKDWLGHNILHLGAPRRWGVNIARSIFWACEEHRAREGEDIFGELMSQPHVNGLTPVEWSLQLAEHSPTEHSQLNERIRQLLPELLSRPRSREVHTGLVEQLAHLLLFRGQNDADADAEFCLSLALSVPSVSWDHNYRTFRPAPAMASACQMCSRHDCELCWICASCLALHCDRCFTMGDRWPSHVHQWIEVELYDDWDWNSDEAQDRFEQLWQKYNSAAKRGLSPVREEPEGAIVAEAVLAEDAGLSPTDNQLQTGLQLATLHAFNRLALRRPLFTPFLPLATTVEASIAPWMSVIRDQRKRADRATLSYESCWTRRVEESDYISRGLSTRYTDEDDVHYGQILEDVRTLHEEHDLSDVEELDDPLEELDGPLEEMDGPHDAMSHDDGRSVDYRAYSLE